MSFRGVESEKGTIVVKSIRFVAVVVRWVVVEIWPLLYNHPANEKNSHFQILYARYKWSPLTLAALIIYNTGMEREWSCVAK